MAKVFGLITILSLLFFEGYTHILRAQEPEKGLEMYTIGPEDVLEVNIYDEESLSRTVPVRIDGRISLPLIGEVQAAGLTPSQLQDVLVQGLKAFIDGPEVSVIVKEPNSFRVYVCGEVTQPGLHRLRSKTTLVQIISMSGGFTKFANRRKILVIRKEGDREKRITINYKSMVSGEISDFPLKPEDTIVVP